MNLLEDLLQRAQRRRRLPVPPARRMLRERAGLTQAEIAGLLHVNRASVSRYESGNRQPRRQLAINYVQLLERLAADSVREVSAT